MVRWESGNFGQAPTGLCDRLGYRKSLAGGRVNETKEGNLMVEGRLEGDRAGDQAVGRKSWQEKLVLCYRMVNTVLIERRVGLFHRRRGHCAARLGNALHTIRLCNIVWVDHTYVYRGHWDSYNILLPSTKASVDLCGRIRRG